jgi:hypothetical protein
MEMLKLLVTSLIDSDSDLSNKSISWQWLIFLVVFIINNNCMLLYSILKLGSAALVVEKHVWWQLVYDMLILDYYLVDCTTVGNFVMWERQKENMPVTVASGGRIFIPMFTAGARSSVVGWGTMLQAGRSRVRVWMRSLDFSIYLILPATIRPWGRLSLRKKWVSGIFLGVKGSRCIRLTSPPFVSQLPRKCGSLYLSQPLWASPWPFTGTALPFYIYIRIKAQ